VEEVNTITVRGQVRAHLTIDEFCELYHVGRTRAFSWIADGTLRSVKIGGSRRIPADAILEWQHRIEVA
jgi:excisionase family DNA binding protein